MNIKNDEESKRKDVENLFSRALCIPYSSNINNIEIVFFPIILFMTTDKPDLNKIEESFIKMITHFEKSSSTSFIKG